MSGFHPCRYAVATPGKAALIIADSGETLSYADLEARSNQSAQLIRKLGLRRGDVIALLLENGPEVFVLSWAAQRTGLYSTSISNKLSAGEIAYILKDCGAKVLVASDSLASLAQAVLVGLPQLQAFTWSQATGRLDSWKRQAELQPTSPIADESPGTDLLYSSGTTGRPKGVAPPLPPEPNIDAPTPLTGMGSGLYGMGEDCVYLSTSPLYHAAPLRWAMTVQRLGGTVVVMPRFDAETTLALIERHRITHGTFVPTHFVRLLHLADDVRARFDLSSLQAIVHAAAPCPVPVKAAMIQWWGPIVHEYYSGTESCGITALSAEEWLKKPGSVGRAVVGTLKIVDDDGRELPAGRQGHIYFADGPAFKYLNDPVKTAAAHNDRGWATLGDIGYVDEDGYLFLTERKDFMIISGGVNIYPQVIESRLVTHPKVLDAAVIGVPHPEMGEEVLAVIQPGEDVDAAEALADDLRAFVRRELGGVMVPRRIVFHTAFPREPNGKIRKAKIRDEILALNGAWGDRTWIAASALVP